MTVITLTAALLADRDRLAAPAPAHNIVPCFVCGYTFVYRGRRGELNGRFCSLRCQEWYDAGGAPPKEPAFSMRRGKEGFYITCAHCQKEFESKGLRCCSKECERAYCERQDNLKVMAEAGIEAAPKKRCAAPGCDAIIPKWKNGRKVSARVTFCSPKCRLKAT
jgi:hypothetical protein